jgi:hypothetical protein
VRRDDPARVEAALRSVFGAAYAMDKKASGLLGHLLRTKRATATRTPGEEAAVFLLAELT